MKTVFLIVGHLIPGTGETDPVFNAVDQVAIEAEKILSSDKDFDCEVVHASADAGLSTLHLEVNRWRTPGDFAIYLRLKSGPSRSDGVSVLCADTPFRQRQGMMITGAVAQSTKLISRGMTHLTDRRAASGAEWLSLVDGLVAAFVVELCYATNKHESKLIASSPELFARGLVEGIHAAAAIV